MANGGSGAWSVAAAITSAASVIIMTLGLYVLSDMRTTQRNIESVLIGHITNHPDKRLSQRTLSLESWVRMQDSNYLVPLAE